MLLFSLTHTNTHFRESHIGMEKKTLALFPESNSLPMCKLQFCCVCVCVCVCFSLFKCLKYRGSVVLFDVRVRHRGTANTSDKPRPIVYMSYVQDWFSDRVSSFLFCMFRALPLCCCWCVVLFVLFFFRQLIFFLPAPPLPALLTS